MFAQTVRFVVVAVLAYYAVQFRVWDYLRAVAEPAEALRDALDRVSTALKFVR
jgi:hypothetical protein